MKFLSWDSILPEEGEKKYVLLIINHTSWSCLFLAIVPRSKKDPQRFLCLGGNHALCDAYLLFHIQLPCRNTGTLDVSLGSGLACSVHPRV